MRNEKVYEKTVECFIDNGNGVRTAIKNVDIIKSENGKYSIIFR